MKFGCLELFVVLYLFLKKCVGNPMHELMNVGLETDRVALLRGRAVHTAPLGSHFVWGWGWGVGMRASQLSWFMDCMT